MAVGVADALRFLPVSSTGPGLVPPPSAPASRVSLPRFSLRTVAVRVQRRGKAERRCLTVASVHHRKRERREGTRERATEYAPSEANPNCEMSRRGLLSTGVFTALWAESRGGLCLDVPPAEDTAQGTTGAEQILGRPLESTEAPTPVEPRSRKVPASQALDLTDWPLVTGSNFALKVPPGFVNAMETPEEEDDTALSTLTMQNKAPKTPFVAKFASPDGAEVVSVLTQPATSFKLSFFEVDDISAFGSIDDAAKVFISPAATILAQREFTATWPRRPTRTYYLYEYVSGGARVAMCLAAAQGSIFVVGASAPQDRWRPVAAQLRAAAGAFLLTV